MANDNPSTDIVTQISPEAEIRDIDGVDWVFYAGKSVVRLGRKKSLPDEWCHPEPGYTWGRCKMIKRTGQRCKNAVRAGWTVCHFHGAGRPSKPGGLTNAQVTTGRHSKHLPARMLARYEAYMKDPDYLSMAAELALIDVRVAERLERLETSDVVQAWMKIRMALNAILRSKALTMDDSLVDAAGLLEEAIDMKVSDEEIWNEIRKDIDARRKVTETERRRVVDAQRIMTYEEANMMIAHLMSLVMEYVQDPVVRRAISDGMRRVML